MHHLCSMLRFLFSFPDAVIIFLFWNFFLKRLKKLLLCHRIYSHIYRHVLKWSITPLFLYIINIFITLYDSGLRTTNPYPTHHHIIHFFLLFSELVIVIFMFFFLCHGFTPINSAEFYSLPYYKWLILSFKNCWIWYCLLISFSKII